jgi:hypothetical protein
MEEFWSATMAVLNIKGFPEVLYKKLKTRAKLQHRSVAQEVIHLLGSALERSKPARSIFELKGLGKEHWKTIDAAEHVRQERDSWD